MSFSEFFNATAGIGDAFVDGRNRREAVKLNDQQLSLLAAQGQPGGLAALGAQTPAAAPQALGALGSPVSRSLPTFASLDGAAPSTKIAGLIAETTAKSNLDPEYLPKLVQIESGGNPNAFNKGSGASGLGQFIPSTARAYGLNDPFDPAANLDATARFTADNRKVLASALGREPTNGELYLGHQQGAGGAAKLLANPNARAADIVGVKAVVSNGGRPDMTAGEFAQKWTSKFGGGGQPRQVASADPEADIPATGAIPTGFQIPGGQSGDFEPGTVASPAITNGSAGALPAVAGQPRITPERVQLLRQMLQNPITAPQAQAEIQRLSAPAKTEYKELGGRVVKTDDRGNISAVPGFEKPAELKQFKGADGNDYVFNPQTGQATRAIQGKPTEFRSLITPQERAAAGIPTTYAGPAQLGPDGELKLPGKASTEVNIDNKGENAFATTANKGIAERFLAIAQEGDSGRTDLAFLGQLRALGSDIGTGLGAQATKVLGDYGIDIGPNTGKVQAYSSLVDKLTPGQRIPGAGATSDFDAKLFKSSLPRLINTPEGNDLISGTLEAVAQDKMARAAIAEKALTGEMKPNEVIRELRNLPSPNLILRSGLSELQKGGKLGAEAPKAGQATPRADAPAFDRSALEAEARRRGIIK